MEVIFGHHVRSMDDHDLGTVKHLILDPENCRVKTLIVEKGLLLPDDIEMPADALELNVLGGLSARYTAAQVRNLPKFDASRYTRMTAAHTDWMPGLPYGGELWPLGGPLQRFDRQGGVLAAPVLDGEMAVAPPPELSEHRQRDDEENAVISAGDDVLSRDGEKVGEVLSLGFDTVTGLPTSLGVREGWLFHTDWTLPADEIASADDGVVYLNLDKTEIETRKVQ